MLYDDLGGEVRLKTPPRRVVSLVPSLTEALASVDREVIVGATEWCTHPGDLDVARVRGTKNPDLGAIRALRPDLVIANKEENRELDVRRLRESGVVVWVTDIETVPDGIASIERLFVEALGWGPPAWLARAQELWCGPPAAPRARAVAVVWRDPWMVAGDRTFTSDLLTRAGLVNPLGGSSSRYPPLEPEDIIRSGTDVVLLPDEPYRFTETDGPEAFPGLRHVLLEGRLVTWYGPSLVEAHRTLSTLDLAPGTP